MEYGSGRAATHILAAADLMTETEFGKTFGRKLVAPLMREFTVCPAKM